MFDNCNEMICFKFYLFIDKIDGRNIHFIQDK